MSRYFFDIYTNGEHSIDDQGQECAALEEVRMEAMRTLPSIAKDEVVKDGDRQAYSVLVTDKEGKAVYSATLTYAGLWLQRD